MRGRSLFFMFSACLVFQVGCSDEDTGGSSCPEGQIYDPLDGSCRRDTQDMSNASMDGATGEFRCVLSADAANPSLEGSADIVATFDGTVIQFVSTPSCVLETTLDGQEQLRIQLNAVVAEDGWALALGVPTVDVAAGASYAHTDQPWLTDPVAGTQTFTSSMARGLYTPGQGLSGSESVGMIEVGALTLDAVGLAVGDTIEGTLSVEAFTVFSTTALNGDACVVDADCRLGQFQFCLFGDMGAPMCASACYSDADCGELGGGCLQTDPERVGFCLPPCETHADCGEGRSCFSVDDTEAYCLPDAEATVFCEADSDCGAGEGCVVGTGECLSLCESGCGAGEACVDRYCVATCSLLEQDCEEGTGCKPVTGVDYPSGACLRTFGVAEGGACGSQAECDRGLVCVQDLCMAFCDRSDPDCEDCLEVEDPVGVCWIGGCLDDSDCAPPDDGCEGDVAVRYRGDGVCAGDGACDFSTVEEREDCGDRGQRCEQGACVGDEPARQPEPGELVITEIMHDPTAVSDGEGEWFEVLNVTGEPLRLSGLRLDSLNDDGFLLEEPGLEVGPGEYVVFGNNADAATNGGVAVDVEYTDLGLRNGSDSVVIRRGDVEIDRVAYGDFQRIAGRSMQLGAQHDAGAVDNADAARWCVSLGLIEGSDDDAGTPGAPNEVCGDLRVVTVASLSDEFAADHPAEMTEVLVSGLVLTTDTDGELVFAQAPGGGPHSGVALDPNGVDLSGLSRGTRVTVTGTYVERFGLVTIALTDVVAMGSAALPPFEVMTPAELVADAEVWEATLVRVEDVAVTSANPDGDRDFGEFAISGVAYEDGAWAGEDGTNLRVDELLHLVTPDPVADDLFARLDGVLYFSFDNFKIIPRDADDVVRPRVEVVEADFLLNSTDITIEQGDAVRWVIPSLPISGVRLELTRGAETLLTTVEVDDEDVWYVFDEPGVYTMTAIGSPIPASMEVTVNP